MSRRLIKNELLSILEQSDFEEILRFLDNHPPHLLLHPLFLALCNPLAKVRWNAVCGFGRLVPTMADKDPESSRIVMRRFLWSLNDESGGIGWGIAEAMGEVMARHEVLAREFAHLLVSYIRDDGNYLADTPLQKGVLWGIGRLAQVHSELLKSCSAVSYVKPFLHSPDGPLRGLAVWALGWLGDPQSLPLLRNLLNDPTEISIFNGNRLEIRAIRDLAGEAIKRLRI